MNKDQFWESIDTVIVAYPDHDRESHMNIIIEKLLNYSLDDIVDWQMMLEEYCNAAYRPEVWSAGQVLGADYTGEGFIDFACWLVSRGKEAYMDALRDPATMFAIPLNGESPNFKQFRFTAYNAYDAKLFHTDPMMSGNLFKAMADHTLAPQTVEAVRQEIPPCSVFAQSWQRRLNPGASDVKEP